ncbi:MAG: hypothetical protein GXO79_09140 [Chlorobi bacterium]|nr:hypothetical protein [Chlorobiota bacterium]
MEKFIVKQNINIKLKNLPIKNVLVVLSIFVICICLTHCSVLLVHSGKSNHSNKVIPLLYDTANLKHIHNSNQIQENPNRIIKYLPPFSTVKINNGELVIENNYQYETSNSRINLNISGKNFSERIYFNQKTGALIEFGNYRIKILSLEKINDNYQPKLLIINKEVVDKKGGN